MRILEDVPAVLQFGLVLEDALLIYRQFQKVLNLQEVLRLPWAGYLRMSR